MREISICHIVYMSTEWVMGLVTMGHNRVGKYKQRDIKLNYQRGRMKTANDLKGSAAPYNPRKITDKKLDILKKTMAEYGDLSGIVLNVRTGRMVGGHQRVKIFDPAWEVEKKKCADDSGTVAEGHIKTPWGKWSYREVDWDEKKEVAANIAANKGGGEWDVPKLADLLVTLDDGMFDMEFTGFDSVEIEKLILPKGIMGDDELKREKDELKHGILITIGFCDILISQHDEIYNDIYGFCGKHRAFTDEEKQLILGAITNAINERT